MSLREIAAEAGTAKPKIYRHFNDKADLFHAIGKRLPGHARRGNLSHHRPGDPHPRWCAAAWPSTSILSRSIPTSRFVLQGRFPEPAESTTRGFSEGARITMAIAEMFNQELHDLYLDSGSLELAAAACFGSASTATEWWLGADPVARPDTEVRRASDDDHARHLAGIADLLEIDLDPDQPLRSATPRTAGGG